MPANVSRETESIRTVIEQGRWAGASSLSSTDQGGRTENPREKGRLTAIMRPEWMKGKDD